MQRVHLIRHGQTTWNAERRWQGVTSAVPLTDEGRAQSRALANYLLSSGYSVAVLYSSDLGRAWETALILGEALGLIPQADARWREVNAGIFQGRTWPDMEAEFPHYVAEYRARGDEFENPDYRFPGGESWAEVQARAYEAFESITAQPRGETVAVVSHGGVIRSLLSKLFHPMSPSEGMRLPNTSITTLDRDGQGWRLVEVGATPHLMDGTTGDGKLV